MNNCITHYGWTDHTPDSYYYIAPLILKLALQFQPASIVDIGCGNGVLCDLLNQHQFNIIGVDSDLSAIEIARQKYPALPFFQYHLSSSLPLKNHLNQLVDMVIATEVIEHLYSPQLLLIQANHCLANQGKLIISTPYHGYLKNLLLSLSNHWDQHHTSLWEGGHIKFFSYKTLNQLLFNYGFTLTQFYGLGRLPYLWKSMLIVAEKTTSLI
jgi:2-polyprenyl-3-methyl-5-hydroxy-6-metoxy-1,4-benzoquinol methylase